MKKLLIFLFLIVNLDVLFAKSTKKESLTDAFGTPVDSISLSFENEFSDRLTIETKPAQLKIVSADDFSVLRASFAGCRVGAREIADRHVEALFDDAPSMTAARAKKGFTLKVRLHNLGNHAGAIHCDMGMLLLDSDRTARVNIMGQVWAPPAWTDSSGVEVSSLIFNYSGLIAGPIAGANVDSGAESVRLVGATSYPATISLARPSGCRIGASNVGNNRVYFLNNGIEIRNNSNFNITTNALQTYGLRFGAAGNYGDNSGAVYCTSAGSLTYTY